MSGSGEQAAYPQAWEADVVLSDGSVALVRPITPEDGAELHRFHAAQSAESIYLRFFAPVPRLSEKDVRRFTHVDHSSRVALVVVVKDHVVGIGRFDRIDESDGGTAEVAFNVADAHRGRGIASVLLEHLAAIGADLGVRRFLAEVLPRNRRMLGVFRDAGYEVSHEFDDGLVAVAFDIEPTDRSRAVRMSREHRSEGRSMRRVLRPESVVVIGVSREAESMGSAVLAHIVRGGFNGQVYAVGRAAARADVSVAGVPVLERVQDLPEPVALAIIAVPAEGVVDVISGCADAQIQNVVVLSSGFADEGTQEGLGRQAEVLAAVRGAGMRVLGPNSFGLINTSPQTSLHATLSPLQPGQGGLGLFAQSGALGIALLAATYQQGLGCSSFVSAGNRSDISGNDLMQYWLDDEHTTAVGLYLESMGNPRKFSRIARQLASVKPVIVVKSAGGSDQVIPGHTVRQTRERPEAFAAMLRQSGVIHVENIRELVDVAHIVVDHPLPAGSRVGVVTNSAALGALAADTCVVSALQVTGPVRTLPTVIDPDEFVSAVSQALADHRHDSVVACLVPPTAEIGARVGTDIAAAMRACGKPCVLTCVGLSPRGSASSASRAPTYALVEDAVRALARATGYALWLSAHRGERVQPAGIERRRAHDVIETFLGARPEGGVLDQQEGADLLSAYGIDIWPAYQVGSARAAKRSAARFGRPVVVKAVADELRHEPGQRWVRTGLHSPQASADAYDDLAESLPPDLRTEIAVQAQAPAGTAIELSTAEDPLFGPVVTFAVAGLPSELLGDVAHRFPPVTTVDVAQMVDDIAAAPVLDGYRGAQRASRPALHDLIARVAVLCEDHPEIATMRLNPVIAHADGVAVLGARIELWRGPTRADAGRRALTR